MNKKTFDKHYKPKNNIIILNINIKQLIINIHIILYINTVSNFYIFISKYFISYNTIDKITFLKQFSNYKNICITFLFLEQN